MNDSVFPDSLPAGACGSVTKRQIVSPHLDSLLQMLAEHACSRAEIAIDLLGLDHNCTGPNRTVELADAAAGARGSLDFDLAAV